MNLGQTWIAHWILQFRGKSITPILNRLTWFKAQTGSYMHHNVRQVSLTFKVPKVGKSICKTFCGKDAQKGYSKHAFILPSLKQNHQLQKVSRPSLHPSLVRLKVPEEIAAYCRATSFQNWKVGWQDSSFFPKTQSPLSLCVRWYRFCLMPSCHLKW